MDLLNIVCKDEPLTKVIKAVLKEDRDAYFNIKVHEADRSQIPESGAHEYTFADLTNGLLTVERACNETENKYGMALDAYLKDRLGKYPYLTIGINFTGKHNRNWAYVFEVDKDLIVKVCSDSNK